VTKLHKMRVRIFDLDAMIAKRVAKAPGGESAVAGLMHNYGPVDKSAVHAIERSNLQILLRYVLCAGPSVCCSGFWRAVC